jgi:hypothetical protein
VAAFKHLWSDSWGPRLEHFLFTVSRHLFRASTRPSPISHVFIPTTGSASTSLAA